MIAKALAVLLLAALALAGVQTWRLNRLQLESAQDAARAATALSDAQAKAREQERRHVEDAARAASQYQQTLEMVSHKANMVIDDLRAGNLRLRRQWQGCQADHVSATAASSGGVDGAEQSRRDSAARIVRAADACDAQVTALQALVLADRAVK